MNNFWANQKGRGPNNRSRGSGRNNQAINSHSSPGGHSRTPPQGTPQRAPSNRSSRGSESNNQALNHTSPPISSRTNPHRPQIHPNFTRGRYGDPNILYARTTQPSRVPFAISTININPTPLIMAARYGHPFPIDLSFGNINALNSPTTQGNLFNHYGIGNSFINGGVFWSKPEYPPSNAVTNPLTRLETHRRVRQLTQGFNGGVDYTPNGFSNYSWPDFTTNGFSYFSRPDFVTNDFPNSLRSNFRNNQRNTFSYGENFNNSSVINDFINNPRTRFNMNNFYNQRSLLSFQENFSNSLLFNNDNFMINPSTSVNMNTTSHVLESNPIMPLPQPRAEINDVELARNPNTNAVDLARERALKRPLASIDVDQETEGSKRPRTNTFCEGQQSEIKELLLFKDSDDGEKNNASSTSKTATNNAGGNENDEDNLDLSLHL